MNRRGRQIAGARVNLQHPGERQQHAGDRDQIDESFRELPAEYAVEQKPEKGEGGNEPEILHQFFSESISSMFSVARFLNTVRMIARPTAASAAATTITKNVKMLPLTSLC